MSLGDVFNTSAWKGGVGYATDLFALNGVFENIRNSNGAGSSTAYYLSAKYNVTADDALKLAFADVNGDAGKANKTGAQQYTVGYDHKMSKHTTLYALYTNLNNDRNIGYQLGWNSASSSISDTAVGGDASAFSLGMKHAF